MFVLGTCMFLLGAALLSAHYLGFASRIPGLEQIPSVQVLAAALAIVGAVLAVLFRRPAD